MRKIFIITGVALILAGLGGWVASTTNAKVARPAAAQIDPMQAMINAKNLPIQHYDDYSLAF
jgi:hypothetical protein